MPFLSNAMIIGDKRKYLSALVSLKTLVDTQGAPTDELAPEAVGWLSAEGLSWF
jgi:long-chain-fatty-acid--CoA ligase ACSBG